MKRKETLESLPYIYITQVYNGNVYCFYFSVVSIYYSTRVGKRVSSYIRVYRKNFLDGIKVERKKKKKTMLVVYTAKCNLLINS